MTLLKVAIFSDYHSKTQQRGALLVYLAILIPVLVVLAAIAVNIGWLYYARNQAQAAVDSAALAAAAGIPHYNSLDPGAAAGNSGRVLALLNLFNGDPVLGTTNSIIGIDPDVQWGDVRYLVYTRPFVGGVYGTPTFEYPAFPNRNDEINGIEISKTYSIPLFLSDIIGYGSMDVNVQSAAVLSGPSCFPIRAPITLLHCPDVGAPNDQCTSNDNCGVVVDFNTAQLNPDPGDNAAIYALATEPPNANICRQRVRGELPGDEVCVGEMISLNNGVLGSCLQEMQHQCENYWFCSVATPWITTVPVVHCDDFRDPSNPVLVQDAPVFGFARIGITHVEAKGKGKRIEFMKICGEMETGAPTGARPCGFYSAPVLVY